MKLLRFFQVALIATVMLGFSACGDDEPDPNVEKTENGNGQSDGENGTDVPLLEQVGILFPVTSISGWLQDDYMVFDYADGRVTGGMYDEVPFTIYTNPLRIVGEGRGEGWYERDVFSNIKVNSHGFVTYADAVYEGEEYYYENGPLRDKWYMTGSYTMSYDNDGHLIKLSAYMEEDGDWERCDVNFTWRDGDLVKAVKSFTWNNEEEEEFDCEDRTTQTFEFGQVRTNPGIFMPEIIVDIEYWYYVGLLGKPSKHIPTSWMEKEEDIENGEVGY